MKALRKPVSLLLVLMMVLSVFTIIPVSASAEEVGGDPIAVFFTNANGWAAENQYAYAYDDNGQATTSAWPGKQMQFLFKNGYNQDVFGVLLPAGSTNVIFNNGGLNQTVTCAPEQGAWWWNNDVDHQEGTQYIHGVSSLDDLTASYHPAVAPTDMEHPGNVAYFELGSNHYVVDQSADELFVLTEESKLTIPYMVFEAGSSYMDYDTGQWVVMESKLVKYNGADTTLTVPDTVPDGYTGTDGKDLSDTPINYIDDGAFSGNHTLTGITFGKEVRNIRPDALTDTDVKTVTCLASGTIFLNDIKVPVTLYHSCLANLSYNSHVGGFTEVTTHNLTHTAAKQPSDYADGNIEYWYCSDCQKYFSDEAAQQEISADSITIPTSATILRDGGIYSVGEKVGFPAGTSFKTLNGTRLNYNIDGELTTSYSGATSPGEYALLTYLGEMFDYYKHAIPYTNYIYTGKFLTKKVGDEYRLYMVYGKADGSEAEWTWDGENSARLKFNKVYYIEYSSSPTAYEISGATVTLDADALTFNTVSSTPVTCKAAGSAVKTATYTDKNNISLTSPEKTFTYDPHHVWGAEGAVWSEEAPRYVTQSQMWHSSVTVKCLYCDTTRELSAYSLPDTLSHATADCIHGGYSEGDFKASNMDGYIAEGVDIIHHYRWDITDPLGHDLTAHPGVAPTYDPATDTYTNGSRAYWYCSRCDKYFANEACTTRITEAEATAEVPYFTFNGVQITGYNGSDAEITLATKIPDNYPVAAYQGNPIALVDNGAFKGNKVITKVIIPDPYYNIGEYAFQNCTNLKVVETGSKLELVQKNAFSGCNLDSFKTTTTYPQSGNSRRIIDTAFDTGDNFIMYCNHGSLADTYARNFSNVTPSYLDQHTYTVNDEWNTTNVWEALFGQFPASSDLLCHLTLTCECGHTETQDYYFPSGTRHFDYSEGCENAKGWLEINHTAADGQTVTVKSPVQTHSEDHVLTREAATVPTYDPATDTYTNGYAAHFKCEACQRWFDINDNKTEIAPEAIVIPYFSFHVNGNTMALDGYHGRDAEIVVPDTVPQSYPVEEYRGREIGLIGRQAFLNNTTITKVTMGDNIFQIADGDSSVRAPFEGCTNLKTVIVGATDQSRLGYIGNRAFYGCNSLEELRTTTTKAYRSGQCQISKMSAIPNSSSLTVYGTHTSFLQKINDYNVYSKVKFIGTDAHNYNVTWDWDEYYGDATATFTCNDCDTPAVTISENVDYESEITTYPTYEEVGYRTHYATVTGPDGKEYTGTALEELPVLDPDTNYYLILNWQELESKHRFTPNTAAPGEYVLKSVMLNAGDEIKVVTSNDGTGISEYYPDGADNHYTVAETGMYDIYFKPDYTGGDDWYHHTFYLDRVIARNRSFSIGLQDEIAFRFYVYVDPALCPDFHAEYSYGNEDYSRSGTATYIAANPDKYYGANYEFTCKVNARAMADEITLKFYRGDEAEPIMTRSYSIAKYAGTLSKAYPKYKNLICSMLDYGDSIQRFFNYELDNLAGSYIPSIDADWETPTFENLPADNTNMSTLDASVYGYKYTSATLTATSQTSVRLFFNITDADAAANTVITVDGKTLTPYKDSTTYGYYCIDITGISARKIFNDQKITFTNGANTSVLTYSPIRYYNWAVTGSNAKLKTVVENLYAYYYYAKEQLG